MRSVRFDKVLDERVQRAAEREGITVSEFVRRAVGERAETVLGQPTVLEAWADYIGSLGSDGDEPTDYAARHKEIWGRYVAEKHARQAGRRRTG